MRAVERYVYTRALGDLWRKTKANKRTGTTRRRR